MTIPCKSRGLTVAVSLAVLVGTVVACAGRASQEGPFDAFEIEVPLDPGPVDADWSDAPLDDGTEVPDSADPDGGQDPGTDEASEDVGPYADGGPPDAGDLPEPPWPGGDDGYRTHGPFLLDKDGRALMMHGINVASAAKYLPDRLSWHTEQDYRDLALRGFDSVRLLTFWGAIMPERGVIDHAYLDAYAERVRWATASGMRVVVDMHQDIFGFGFGEDGAPRWACDEALYESYSPRQPWYLNYMASEVRECFDRFYGDDELFALFRDAWVAVAERVKDNPAVVGFDLLNEPNWGGAGDIEAWLSDTWQPRMEYLTRDLKQVAPDKIVFWQGSTMFSVGHVDPFVPPESPGVALGAHYYHPLVHDGGEYDPDLMRDHLDMALDAMDTSAGLMGGVPVWMGEMGGPVGARNFDVYMKDLLARLAARAWGWSVWSDDKGGFGVRDPSGVWRDDYVRLLNHPAARAIPGRILEQSIDFQTGSFLLSFKWEVEAPLEIWTGDRGDGTTVVMLEPQGDGAPATCAQAEGAVAGVQECLPDGASETWLGHQYRLQIGSTSSRLQAAGLIMYSYKRQ
jgi:endoglycosylceramidase